MAHSVPLGTGRRRPAVAPLYDPGISPDGSEIAFASGGDIWTAPAAGGVAHLLISDPATESRPVYSPDGKTLAFVSTRTGNGDIYIFDFATGQVRRLTFDDAHRPTQCVVARQPLDLFLHREPRYFRPK